MRGTRSADQGDEDNGQYVRVLHDLDVSKQASCERVIGLIGESVLKNLAVRVVLDRQPEEDTAVGAFIETLKMRPSLHFTSVQKTP